MTLTFNSQVDIQLVEFDILDDDVYETTEEFLARLSFPLPTPGVTLQPNLTVIQIEDNDGRRTIQAFNFCVAQSLQRTFALLCRSDY